jgi:hypothetical protein
MPDLTEEEYDALDEYYTKNPPKVSGDGKSGFFMKHKGNVIIVNDVTATYLRARADTVHKSPSEIVDEMVQERITASAVTHI